MNKCPITYEDLNEGRYSPTGLKKLSASLKDLLDFPYSAVEQRKEAAWRMQKMSIQGVQPKLSCKLNVRRQCFQIVELGGTFILKPQNDIYEQLPENEDLTMKLAHLVGIETPLHGLLYAKDGSLSYFIKRFDRKGRNKKLAVEDFAQLAGHTRETKYAYSLEKMILLIEQYTTFPMIEKEKFFRRILFCYLTGNEDMHLKNFSLIRRNQKVEFSPAYDLLNTTLAMGGAREELALSLAGKKSNFNRTHFLEYLGRERLQLPKTVIQSVCDLFRQTRTRWKETIQKGFLSQEQQAGYLQLLDNRFNILFPTP